MNEFKTKITRIFKAKEKDVLMTHGNTSVISENESKNNLREFMIAPEKSDDALYMVAMNIFNEGLHVDGVIALEMFRQISESSNEEKEDPTTLFLQQIGRCIHSIRQGEVIEEPPIIFDFACNFMRFNERLNGLFKISENQTKFKTLFDECMKISKEKAKSKELEEIDEIPKSNILGRTLGMMEALSKCGVDISNITKETTWGELSENLSSSDKQQVLNWIYVESGMRIDDSYKVGLYIISARNAFWHREVENPKTSRD